MRIPKDLTTEAEREAYRRGYADRARALKAAARRGGRARADKIDPAERSRIARAGATARWAKARAAAGT